MSYKNKPFAAVGEHNHQVTVLLGLYSTARLIWRRGSSQGRLSVQFLGFFLPRTPPSPQRSSGLSWAPAGQFHCFHGSCCRRPVQGQGFQSSAGQPREHPSPARLRSVLRSSTVTAQPAFHRVTGSFRTPRVGNVKSKSVC